MPKISIIIASYNEEEYIKDCLDSIHLIKHLLIMKL